MRDTSSERLAAAVVGWILLAVPVSATCGGGGGGGVGGMGSVGGMHGFGDDEEMVFHVPWKVIHGGDPAPAGLYSLYWFPNSKQEAVASELQSSRQLALAASRCVAMTIVAVDHAEMRAKFGAAENAALAVLVDASDGSELARYAAKHGPLDRSPVERMLRETISRREDALDKALAEAKAKADKGEKDAAVALYMRVWNERCFDARAAKKAARALEKLGAPVAKDARLDLPAPDPRPATGRAIAHALTEGLRAESELHILEAERWYAKAEKLDPADPAPLRFLGELYRHHIGDWTKARGFFDRILALRADPLSRAVALHGLGKMTIHEGDNAAGLALFDRSLAEYPLALAYRNLAVFWSSEGNLGKAYGYVEQALALEPDDEYNLIFAATFFVEQGRTEEAARVVERHEAMLEASYNLAAIYAQMGRRDKALELLQRHFYVYERFDAVRAKEMQEARVDRVFTSLKTDPAFVALTAQADGAGMR